MSESSSLQPPTAQKLPVQSLDSCYPCTPTRLSNTLPMLPGGQERHCRCAPVRRSRSQLQLWHCQWQSLSSAQESGRTELWDLIGLLASDGTIVLLVVRGLQLACARGTLVRDMTTSCGSCKCGPALYVSAKACSHRSKRVILVAEGSYVALYSVYWQVATDQCQSPLVNRAATKEYARYPTADC
jgi:hypothetical protein